jgi:hypothetical protein
MSEVINGSMNTCMHLFMHASIDRGSFKLSLPMYALSL